MTEQRDSKRKNIRYVAPSPELVEQIARKVCDKLAVAHPLCSHSEVVHSFTTFLSVVSRMYTNHLNGPEHFDEVDLLDNDTQKD